MSLARVTTFLGVLACASVAWVLLPNGDVETCEVLDGPAFAAASSTFEQSHVFTPEKPVPITLRLGFPVEMSQRAVLVITLGTAADPDGVEYLGPVSTQLHILADQGIFGLPKYPTPSIEVVDPETQLRCYWTTEEGLALTGQHQSYDFALELLGSRRSDIMGNIEIVDNSE